jgi:hypothetical protein
MVALLNVLLPAVICGAVLSLGRLKRAPMAGIAPASPLPAWLGALAIVAAFLAAHAAVLGMPRFDLWEHRAAYAAALVGIACLALSALPSLARLLLLVVAGVCMAWLVTWPAMPAEFTISQRWLIILGSGTAAGCVMHALAELSHREAGWRWTLTMLPAFAAASLLCLRADYAKYVHLTIGAAAAVGAGMIASIWLRQPLGRGFGAGVAGLLCTVLLGGYFHGPEVPPDDPAACFVMVGLSPFVLFVGRSRFCRGRATWLIACVEFASMVALLGVAALLAVRLAGV